MRLLTSPAWLAADSARSRKVVKHEDLAHGEPTGVLTGAMGRGLVASVAVGLADEDGRETQPEARVRDAEEERRRPQPVALGQEPGGSAVRASAP